MSTATTRGAGVVPRDEPDLAEIGPGGVFLALLGRDVRVTRRELGGFLAQTLVQPLFLLFVFAVVLDRLGLVSTGYGQIMLPGLIALNAFLGGLQSVAFPLVFDFAWTREIEDRLLAPVPLPVVALEKVVFGALRGLIASLAMVPIGFLLLDDVRWPVAGLAPAFGMTVLGAVLGGATGLALGTSVPAKRINVVFSVLLAPLIFTGGVEYPLPSLGVLPWFQVISACNPLTYVSEGVRAALVPQVPHVPPWTSAAVGATVTVVVIGVGVRGFVRRSVD